MMTYTLQPLGCCESPVCRVSLNSPGKSTVSSTASPQCSLPSTPFAAAAANHVRFNVGTLRLACPVNVGPFNLVQPSFFSSSNSWGLFKVVNHPVEGHLGLYFGHPVIPKLKPVLPRSHLASNVRFAVLVANGGVHMS